MSRDEVEQDADPELARGRDQSIEVLDRPQVRMDAAIVRDVVAPITVRRWKSRVDPDAVDAEPVKVVQARAKARKVADAVTVRVSEGPRIGLIQNATGPPRVPERSQ